MSFEYKITEKIEKMNIDKSSAKEIANKLGFFSKFEIKEITKVIRKMTDNGKLYETKQGKYSSVKEIKKYTGILRGNKRGFAFLIREDGGEDLFIPHKGLNGAMHGDTVRVKIIKGDEGQVVDIVERGITRLVGSYQKSKNYGFVVPDDNNYYSDIFIPNGKDMKAADNTKVIVEIFNFSSRNPEGRIVEIIGNIGEKSSDVLSILKSYGFDNVFPKEVEEEAKTMQYVPTGNRSNFVDMLTMTIDGDDSKDLDDAISVFKIGDLYKLYVHIADVSHYVLKGSVLDREAFKRATSVYFPGSVYPMLPPVLSNGICSLNEGEDRLGLTAIMLINKSGSVVESEIVKSVINNNYRMTYGNVTKILDGDEELINKYKEIVPMIRDAYDLSRILKKRRESRGSINFETKESKIVLDDNGNVDKIVPYPYTVSNEIIEEFMLLANETVAETISSVGLPFVYRVHENPDKEKMIEFKKFVKSLGLEFPNGEIEPRLLQELLDSIKGSALENIVSKVMLRSMKKARYSTENSGHFGLASDNYCHFTSPIRRYPDLQIHRIIKDRIDNKLGSIPKLAKWCEEVAEVSSERERASESAERDIDDYYKAEYMLRHIGEEFNGVISGVTSFGIFVELENTCEGLARLDNLPSDNYNFIEERYKLQGFKHSYSLGDKTRIRVVSASLEEKRVIFEILDEVNDNGN